MSEVTYLHPDRAPARPARARLTPWQRMEVEHARQVVGEAGSASAAELGSPRLAYVAGRLEGVAANLLDILDAITEAE